MKTISLIGSRLAAYFQKNKLVFLLFLLGGILNSFVLACFFGEAKELIRIVSAPEESPYQREYSIQWWPYGTNENSSLEEGYLGFPNEKRWEEIKGNLVEIPIEGYGKRYLRLEQAKTLAESKLLEQVTVEFISREQNSHSDLHQAGQITVAALVKGNTPVSGIPGGTGETLEFVRGNVKYENLKDDQIILNQGHSAKVGDTVTVCGTAFRVAAVAKNLYSGNLITPKAMEKLSEGTLDVIRAISKDKYDEKDNLVIELFHRVFTEFEIVNPDIPYPVPTVFKNCFYLSRPDGEKLVEIPKQELQHYTERLTFIFFCYFASQGAFLILLRYLLHSLAQENAVSMIVGMKRRHLSLLIFSECMTLAVSASLFGLLLHRLLTPYLFVRINSAYYLAESFGDYTRLFLMMLAINLAILIPFVLLYRTKTPVELRRKQQ